MELSFGQTLRVIRKQLGLSQLELATVIGSTQRHLSFLETGRSQPSPSFIVRIATSLRLSMIQKAALFDASQLPNPYRSTGFTTGVHSQTLDLVKKRVLDYWPFAGFALSRDWTVLRCNSSGEAMLNGFGVEPSHEPSLFELFLSEQFRQRVENWEDVCPIFYFRLQRIADKSEKCTQLFKRAVQLGLFDSIHEKLTGTSPRPAYVPAILVTPEGRRLQLTSLVGHLPFFQEATLEDVEIELMIPIDDQTEQALS